MMRNFTALLLLLFFVNVACAQEQQTAKDDHKLDHYKIKVKINGLKDTSIYLGFHMGNMKYIHDTTRLDKNGVGVFEKKGEITGGIYLIITPSKNYFEILLNEPEFSVEADTADFVKSVKTKGSKENKLFYDYLAHLDKKRKEGDVLKAKRTSSPKDSVAIRQQLEQIEEDVNDYKRSLKKEHPNTFFAKLMTTMEEPEVPEAPKGPDGEPLDPQWDYHYFKEHYLDKVDFSDPRLLRTPLLHSKVTYYLDKITAQHPDSLAKATDMILEKASANKDVYKFVLITLFNKYASSQIMGFDAVYVHLAKNHYLSGKATWADSSQLQKIQERVYKLEHNLIGKKAVNLNLYDSLGKRIPLHGVNASYTIVYFWDSDCGHCKKITPQVKAIYDKYKEQGVKVYAVNMENKTKNWKKYVQENQLDWINVIDTANESHFRAYYDIYSTPVIYLLNKEKVIRAKRLSTEQLDDMLDHFLNKGRGEQ